MELPYLCGFFNWGGGVTLVGAFISFHSFMFYGFYVILMHILCICIRVLLLIL